MYYFVLCLFCKALVILLCAGMSSAVSAVNMSFRILDPNGRESLLVYDGGKLNISCWDDDCKSNRTLRSSGPSRHSKTPLPQIVEVAGNKLLESINAAAVEAAYLCQCKHRQSQEILLQYVLCSQRSVKPSQVCSKPNQFCHITHNETTECKSLTQESCNYNPSVARTLQAPTFKAVCTGTTRHDTGNQKPGLCYYLAVPHNPPPLFTARSYQECDHTFNVYTCLNKCRSIKRMALIGWDFMDVMSPFSIYVLLSGTQKYDVVCSAANTNESLIRSRKVKPAPDELTEMVGFGEELGNLSTPTIADIVCVASDNDTIRLQFQTYLLLFRSDTDLTYNITEENVGMVGERVLYRLIVQVTAADGFYTCVGVTKGLCRQEMTNENTLDTIVSFKQVGDNYTTTFYISLFVSSPKDKHVLVHRKIISYRVNSSQTVTKIDFPGTTLTAPTTSIPKDDGLVTGLVIGMITASVIAVVLIIVTIVIRFRERKAIPVCDRGEREEALVPKGTQRPFRGKAAPFSNYTVAETLGPFRGKAVPFSNYTVAETVGPKTIQSKIKSLDSGTKSYSLKLSQLSGVTSKWSAKNKP